MQKQGMLKQISENFNCFNKAPPEAACRTAGRIGRPAAGQRAALRPCLSDPYSMPSLLFRPSCSTLEKFMFLATASSLSHSGIVSVFLTDFLLFLLWYSKVSHAI